MYKNYAISHSLYSGRARSYLIKAGIPFREVSTGYESFKIDVLPIAGLPTIPTLRTPRGAVIRDGAMIIDYFESQNRRSFQSPGVKQYWLGKKTLMDGCKYILKTNRLKKGQLS